MTRSTIFGAALATVIFAAPIHAQTTNPFSLEPYAGAFTDAYDISPDGDNSGILAGIRVGYQTSDRLRAVANVGYARTHDVSNPNGLPSYWVYDNTWAITTLGGEFDVVTGSTSASLGLQVGAGWRRNDLAGEVGQPDPATDWYSHGGFEAIDLIAPGITLRQRVIGNTSLMLTLQDQIFDFLEGPAEHSPSLTVGISVR